MNEQNEPSDPNYNTVSEWEGADEIEQDLQDKIRSNMENQEPKIEGGSSEKLDKNRLLNNIETYFWGRSFYEDVVKLGAELDDKEFEELNKAWETIRKLIDDHPESQK